MRISLFVTCYNDMLFPETGKAVVRVPSGSDIGSSSGANRLAAGRCITTPATSATHFR